MSVTDAARRAFVTGALFVAPLAVTVFVGKLLYGWLTAFLGPLVSVVPGPTVPFVEPLAIVGVFAAVTLLGVVIRQGVGDGVLAAFDRLMEQVPGVRAVYTSARQASSALVRHGEQFERVVLVRWPREGVHTIGFVTAETPDAVSSAAPDADATHYNVFVPMTPNPMGGFLAVVPEDRFESTDLSVSEGLQLLLTTGLQGDDEFRADQFGDESATE